MDPRVLWLLFDSPLSGPLVRAILGGTAVALVIAVSLVAGVAVWMNWRT